MQGDLTAAVEAFHRVLDSAREIVDSDRLEPIATAVEGVRRRLGYLGDTLVAAVAGGTGSGKSSLVNALAGEVVSESGGMRPTTGVPMAWIPASPEPGLTRLLDDLGVDERVGQDLYPWLAVLDLPDTDSVVVDHRHTVQALLPRIDLILWVVDPEKYQDRVLHDDYLKPLAPYHRQFVFVLNQVDRLDTTARERMIEDLRQTLRVDGIPDPRIVMTAADPDAGPPWGIEELVELLQANLDVKQLVYDKLTTDLKEAARALWESPELSGTIAFEERWDEVRFKAARLLADGGRKECEDTLARFVAVLSEEVGPGTGAILRDEVDDEAVSRATDVAYESSGAYRRLPPPPAPRWVAPLRWLAVAAVLGGVVAIVDALRQGGSLLPGVVVVVGATTVWLGLGLWTSSHRTAQALEARRRQRENLVEPIARQLDTHLGELLRKVLRRRAGATAAATELNLHLEELERRLGV